MICDENYKYICYGEPDSEELFDLKKDRLEKINVAKDPSYASVLDHKLGYCNHEGLSAVEVYAQSIKKG